MAKIKEQQAIEAYKAIHALQQEKKEITKEQKEHKDLVKAYLDEHPEGFYVMLEDARGKVHDHHIFKSTTERVSLDKESLRAKLLLKLKEAGETSYHVPKTLTSAYLARMVEHGYITADEIEGYEDVQESKTVKKQKMKGGRPKPVEAVTKQEGIRMDAGEQATLKLGEGGATLTVKRGDTVEVHRPQVKRVNRETGEETIIQEASIETRPADEEPPRTWKV